MLNQKGLAPVLILVGLLLVTVLVGSIFYKSRVTTSNPKVQNPVVTPTTQSTLIPQISMEVTRPDDFSLVTVWQTELVTYTNPKLSVSFKYPKSFIATINNTRNNTSSYSSDSRPIFSLTIKTPDVPIERRQNPGFDFNSYDANTMRVDIDQYDNPNKLTVYDFIADQNKVYPGDGIQETFETYKEGLNQTAIPKPGSYVFEGNVGENPIKKVYFENKGSILVFSMGGGNNTGEGYSNDANKLFENLLTSIIFE